MELEIVPYSTVSEAILKARADMAETNKFNTVQHSHDEIAVVVPESLELQHVKPSMVPGKYCHWVSLIMASQRAKEWHVFELPRYLAREMTKVGSIWHIKGDLNQDHIADLVDLFPQKSKNGVDVRDMRESEWFIRLDLCSTKDGENHTKPVKNVTEFVRQLCSSMRATTAMRDTLNDDPLAKPKIYLVPYNKDMNPGWEFRVFCPPPTGKIAAISQYRWTHPCCISSKESADALAQKVLNGAAESHRDIMEHGEKLEDTSVLETMKREGFTFDVTMPPDGRLQFVEINPFGAMSGCGSCLFHWIKDAKILYGTNEGEKVTFRVAL